MSVKKRITIFGGDTYIGSATLARLAKQGHAITAPVKYPYRVKHLKLNTYVKLLPINFSKPREIGKLVQNSDVVINFYETTNPKQRVLQQFDLINHQFCKHLLQICIQSKVKHLIHHSTLGLNYLLLRNPYWQSKFYGEKALFSSGTTRVSAVQTSWVFGENSFYSEQCVVRKILSILQSKSPICLISGKQIQLAPIHIQELVDCYDHLLNAPTPISHQRYKAYGRNTITLETLIQKINQQLKNQKVLLSVPNMLCSLLSKLRLGSTSLLPSLTTDMNFSLAYAPRHSSEKHPTHEGKTDILQYIDGLMNHKPLTEQFSDWRKHSQR